MKKNKILITGAAGFIGSHLTEKFIQQGYKVVAFDQYNSLGSRGWLEDSKYKNQIEFVLGDIREYGSVYNAMKDCYAAIHLAALIGIPYSYKSPLAYVRTNVEGTYNLLESAKNLNIKKILITSTSETFGTGKIIPMNEEHPINAQSPYAASKIAADQLALSYHKSFKLPVTIIKPFNTYGPRQSARELIPSIIIQCLNKNKKIKIGNLKPTRDLTYVGDTCNAFLEIFKTNLPGEIINIGNNNEISVKELCDKIFMNFSTKIIISQDKRRIRPNKSEVNRLICDNKKILSLTKWKPKTNLENGIKMTIKWLKNNKKNYKSNLYNV